MSQRDSPGLERRVNEPPDDMKQKIFIASLVTVTLLLMLVAIGYRAAAEGKLSSHDLRIQDVPLVVYLGQMRAGVLRVVSSTSELIVNTAREGDEQAGSEEGAADELRLIEAGSAEFVRAQQAVAAMVAAGHVSQALPLDEIQQRYDQLLRDSRGIIDLLRRDASAKEILVAKEAFERSEQAALSAVESSLERVQHDVSEDLEALDLSIDHVLNSLIVSAAFGLVVLVLYMRYVLVLWRREAAARVEAVAANRAKSQFLATVSHELRTPLNGILGLAELMRIETEMSAAQRQDYAATIQDSGKTLLCLLNDILDLSKVEAGKMELSATVFEPARLVDGVVRLFEPIARAKGLSIEGH